MSKDNNAPPAVIGGTVIGRSIIRSVGFIILFTLFFGGSALLVYLKVTGTPLFGTKVVTWWGLVIGIVLVLFCPFMIFGTIRAVLVRNRLILGSDRFQIVQRVKGVDTVMIQVPYANIGDIKFEDPGSGRRIGIDLLALDDPNTYALKHDFAISSETMGRHLVLDGAYQGGLKSVSDRIKERRAAPPQRS